MNRKEIFEKVKTHLLTQGRKSLSNGGCAYRASNGDKCAIGCLITDECYKPELENRPADSHSIIEALKCSGIEVEMDDRHFLRGLQIIHDGRAPDEWRSALATFAKEYNL